MRGLVISSVSIDAKFFLLEKYIGKPLAACLGPTGMYY